MTKLLEQPASRRGVTPAAEDRPRLLLVDDEPSILSALKRLLRREGYEILTADSGPRALEILDQTQVDVVMTDFRMPEMTGTELLKRVHERWPDTKRIVLSGYSEVTAVLDAINSGAIYKYLNKPWNDEELKLHLKRAVEQHRLESANLRLIDEVERQNEQLRELNARLDRRAADANLGLAVSQAMMERVAALVLGVDRNGLVVGAFGKVNGLLEPDRELISVPLSQVLPQPMQGALPDLGATDEPMNGRFTMREREVQWRSTPYHADGEVAGHVLTLWEAL